MHTEYRIVWVSRDHPDIVEDIFCDGIECPDDLKKDLILANSMTNVDDLDWVIRVQRVTYEFI